MKTIRHRFIDYKVNPETETLIIGTFNPETEKNEADFFYGRSRNYLWKFLPVAFGKSDLKDESKQKKSAFITKYKIDFADLIEEIQVEEGQEANYDDHYIDDKVTQWKDIISLIDKLPNLKRVCFTRKTFSDIPNIEKQFPAIQKYCVDKRIAFQALISPARFYSEGKQTEWSSFLNGNK